MRNKVRSTHDVQTLLIDNSNTRTKFAIGTREAVLGWKVSHPTRDLSAAVIESILEEIDFQNVVLCSVVPEKARLFQDVIQTPIHCVSSESRLSFSISYPKPEEIGADRLANAEAAYHQYSTPCIIIDSGTAVTFDVLDCSGQYAGGVISPGLHLMTDYFVEKTALLPKIQLTEPSRFIGQSTEEAMNIGAIAGFRGLIREILTGLVRELGDETSILATGGDAELLFSGIQLIQNVEPDLTLEGIRRIGLLNQ